MIGAVSAQSGRSADDGAGQRLDLDRLALLQVDEQRRPCRWWNAVQVAGDASGKTVRQPDAFCAADGLDLLEGSHHRLSCQGIGPERADGQPRRARERGERREVAELLPDRDPGVGDGLGLDVRARKRLMQSLDALG